MEIALSDDQEFFRDTTRKFLGSECPIPKVRELRGNPAGFERDYWRQGAELGWMSMLVPEELGGGSVSGNGLADLALVADAFGGHVAPGPLLPCNVVAAALARSGSDEQQAELLPAIVAGELVATWASTEAPPHDGLGDVAIDLDLKTARPARIRGMSGNAELHWIFDEWGSSVNVSAPGKVQDRGPGGNPC